MERELFVIERAKGSKHLVFCFSAVSDILSLIRYSSKVLGFHLLLRQPQTVVDKFLAVPNTGDVTEQDTTGEREVSFKELYEYMYMRESE